MENRYVKTCWSSKVFLLELRPSKSPLKCKEKNSALSPVLSTFQPWSSATPEEQEKWKSCNKVHIPKLWLVFNQYRVVNESSFTLIFICTLSILRDHTIIVCGHNFLNEEGKPILPLPTFQN